MTLATETEGASALKPRTWTIGDTVTLEGAVFVLLWALSALALAVIGVFEWWLVVILSVISLVFARRYIPRARVKSDIWWRLAVVVAGAAVVVSFLNPAEHLLTGRDSGTYMATATWLASESSLLVDIDRGAIGGIGEVEDVLPGFYQREGGRGELEPQFMHAFPAMLATLIDGIGLRAAYWLNPVLGGLALLALFSLSRRMMSGWASLLAVSVVAASLVFLYYARAPFSELLMMVFVLSGLLATGIAEERRDGRLALVAGALLGGAVVARIDGVVLLIPVTFYLLVRSRAVPDCRRLLASIRRTAFLVALIGLAESLFVAPAYILERSSFVAAPLMVVLVMLVGNDLLGDRIVAFWRKVVAPNRLRLFVALAAVGALLLAYGWLVRPHVAAPGSSADLSLLQVREGLEVEPRSYAELSVRWLTWYLGLAFPLAGFVGLALLFRRAIDGALAAPSWLVPSALLTFALLYLWRPSITPDHIWVMRRYLTVVIPLGALAAALAVEWVVSLVRKWHDSRWLATAAGWMLATGLLIPTVVTTLPVWDVHEYEALSEDFEAMCSDLDGDSNVLIVDDRLAQFLVQGFRSICGLPAAWIDTVPESTIEGIRDRVEEAGGSLVIVRHQGPGDTYLDGDYRRLDLTLTQPPAQSIPFPIGISVER